MIEHHKPLCFAKRRLSNFQDFQSYLHLKFSIFNRRDIIFLIPYNMSKNTFWHYVPFNGYMAKRICYLLSIKSYTYVLLRNYRWQMVTNHDDIGSPPRLGSCSRPQDKSLGAPSPGLRPGELVWNILMYYWETIDDKWSLITMTLVVHPGRRLVLWATTTA